MDELSVVRPYLISLGIGLLMGLERERAKGQAPGLRTFALVALAGTTAALIGERTGTAWLIGAVLLAVAALAVTAYLHDPKRAQQPGTTTNAALLLCYLLGALSWYGPTELAVSVAVTATLLLYFKPELHGFSHRISAPEMRAILQLAAVAFLLLPLLPDQAYGPWQAINPFRIGLLVVLISGLSLAGYAALKLLDHQHAVAALGLLGGAVSSTATTLAFSRHARAGVVSPPVAALIVALANLTVLLRLALIAAAAAPQLLRVLAPILATALACGAILPLRSWRRLPPQPTTAALEMKNPADLRSAFSFALLFSLVLLITAGANDWLGSAGLFAVAGFSGLTDVDAISLSAMQLHQQNRASAATAIIAICVAYAANLLFKLGAVAIIGGAPMARTVGAAFATVLAGLALGALLWL